MAYIKTYTFHCRSNAGVTYSLEFHDNGSNASNFANLEGTLGKGAIKLKYGSDGSKMFAELKPSTLSIDLMVTDTVAGNYMNEIRNNRQEQDVYVYLYLNGTNYILNSGYREIFAGFLLMDLSDDPDISVPYNIKLTAVDGLAALKYYDFIPPHIDQNPSHLYYKYETYLPDSNNSVQVYPTYRTFIDWISLILQYSGYARTSRGANTTAQIRTAVNWFNGQMPDLTGDPLNWTQGKADPFYKSEGEEGDIKYKPMNCYDALKAICRAFGMRCLVYKNRFMFISLSNFANNESGTLAVADNIRNHLYDINGSYISAYNNIGYNWGQYQLFLSNSASNTPTPNQKLAGGIYGVLPCYKRVSVDFMNVSNINHFQAFPLLETPWQVSSSQGNSVKKETIGIFTFDGINPKTFYTEIYLNFVNQNPNPVEFDLLWTIESRLVSPTVGGWRRLVIDWNALPNPTFHWYTASGMPPANIVWAQATINLPIGASTHNIATQGTSGGFTPYCMCPIADFPAGDYEFRYMQASEWVSNSNTISGHGHCETSISTFGTFTDPESNSVTYANSTLTTGFGSSMFSPIENGVIGTASTNTNLVQTGNDTAFEEIKDVKFGDTASTYAAASLRVWDGTNFVDSLFAGFWGVETLSGGNSLSETLAEEIFKRQAKNVKKFSTKTILLEDRYLNDGTATRAAYYLPYSKFITPTHSSSGTPSAQWIMHTGEFDIVNDTWSLNLYEYKTFTTGFSVTTNGNLGTNSGGVGTGGYGDPVPNDGGSQAAIGNPSGGTIKAIENLQIAKTVPLASINIIQALGLDPEANPGIPNTEQTITFLDVNAMPDAILKAGDTISLHSLSYSNRILYPQENSGILTFIVSTDQEAGATRILVNSKVIYQGIYINDQIFINQNDLFKQYNNKTKGTIAGFAIDSDGISKNGIEIKSWLNSNTLTGATEFNLATASSIKAYVDASAGGTTPSLQAVTDIGSTTSNNLTGAGATFSGMVVVPRIPIGDTSATPKSYVDTQIASAISSIFSMLTCTGTTITSASDGVANAVIMKFDTEAITSGGSSAIVVYGSEGIEGIGNSTFCWKITAEQSARFFEQSWNVTSNTNTVNNRLLSGVRLQQGTITNDQINWFTLDPSSSYIYDRGLGNIRRGSTAGSIIVSNPSSSIDIYYRMQFWKQESSNAGVKSESVLNGTQISIKQLK